VIRADRRQFICLGLHVVGAAAIAGAHSWAGDFGSHGLTVFDHRFDEAQRLALQLAHGGPLQPIAGDATELALWLQSQVSTHFKVTVRGVTPESIPFVLGQFVSRARVSIQRLDRDLFAWTLRLPG
jgi:hypothetical protein